MATDGRMSAVLKNFLGTYTSRYSDFEGYWLFGFLVASLDELRINLLDPPASPSEPAFGVAMRLAVEKFQDQVRKASLARHRVQSAWLTLRRSPGTVRGTVNSHAGLGYRVEFIAEAVTDDGRRHEQACVLFVAPHNPAAEFRSAGRLTGRLSGPA